MGASSKRPPSRSPKRRSAKQRELTRSLSISDKENYSPSLQKSPKKGSSPPPPPQDSYWKSRALNYEKRFRSSQKQVKRLSSAKDALKSDVLSLRKENSELRAELKTTNDNLIAVKEQLSSALKVIHQYAQEVISYKRSIKALSEKWRRATKIKDEAMDEIKRLKSPALLKLTRSGRYSAQAKAMVRIMVLHGCNQRQVPSLIKKLLKLFGFAGGRTMSKRTVARAILEGGVAAKLQLAHEIKQSQSFTISADSTSHRHLNYEAKQIAVRASSYDDEEGSEVHPPDQLSPKVRLLGIDQTPSHSSEASKASWLARLGEILTLYNASPLAKRQTLALDLSELASKLMGMNGDHASAEKCTAGYMADWKKEEAIKKLGEQSLEDLAPPELIALMISKIQGKIDEAGGMDAWEALGEAEQSRRDSETVKQLVVELGKASFDRLSGPQQREITLFLWAGCCMHKDQNSFKGGNTAMMAGWAEMGLEPPILLANKHNAGVLSRMEKPATELGRPLTTDELAAMEKSTRGGAKVASIAGALFNNKDDKKGQGDTYRTFFEHRYGKSVTFPDTNNTRFGSHGEAAIELIKYRDGFLAFLNEIKHKKNRPEWTNMEQNLANALEDIPTLTELCVLALYMLSVTFPYMRSVRGPGTEHINGLELGPFHIKVRAHVQKIIDDPSILLAQEASYKNATLDGEPWEDTNGLTAIRAILPDLPHVRPLLIKFFTGALGTWIRFTSEYAPGGLIDGTTPAERHAAWMPATNDANEGALGTLRRYLREKPLMSVHQYNALATWRVNDTQNWMDKHLTEEDYDFIAREARRIDAGKLEKTRKAAQAEHDRTVADAGRLKLELQKQRAEAKKQRLANITLLRPDEEARIHQRNFTVAMMDEQLDLLRSLERLGKGEVSKIPPKSAMKVKALRKAALLDALRDYYSRGGVQEVARVDEMMNCEDEAADCEEEGDSDDEMVL